MSERTVTAVEAIPGYDPSNRGGFGFSVSLDGVLTDGRVTFIYQTEDEAMQRRAAMLEALRGVAYVTTRR